MKANDYTVIRVSEATVTVAVNGENKSLPWDALRASSHQSDAALAAIYRGILREAESMAADGPVVVSVHQDYTNVWWVATVRALHGGGEANYPRRRDEGGTLPNHLLAASEAEDICQRIGARVARREGFDGLSAKQRIREIMSRV